MRIEIVRVVDAGSGTVEFRSGAGTAVGRWEGPPPVVGEVDDVELDVPDAVTEWSVRGVGTGADTEADTDTNTEADAEAGSMEAVGDGLRVRVVGCVEEIGDPVVVLRVGTGLLLVEFADAGSDAVPDALSDAGPARPPLRVGAVVDLVAEHIRLFPTGL